MRKDYLPLSRDGKSVNSIYFGGGTPSLLSSAEIKNLLDTIREHYPVDADTEITLEANPDDLSEEKLAELKEAGINRLSIGIQSFFEEDLKLMNRAHNAKMAIQCVNQAAAAGFKNITIDLIYGVPGLTEERWKENLDIAFSLPVQHLSCYSLTIEKHTVLDKLIRESKLEAPDEGLSAKHFTYLMKRSVKEGFEHYEISNFGKPGFYSRHNSNYWKNIPYLGIGPSAHSYNGTSRQWNIAANAYYVLSVQKNELNFQIEELTIQNRFNEYVMTGLRTSWGVDLNYLRNNFSESYTDSFLESIDPFIRSEDVMENKENYRLTEKGKLIADLIASECFIVNDNASS